MASLGQSRSIADTSAGSKLHQEDVPPLMPLVLSEPLATTVDELFGDAQADVRVIEGELDEAASQRPE
jgi:hypothetical protein